MADSLRFLALGEQRIDDTDDGRGVEPTRETTSEWDVAAQPEPDGVLEELPEGFGGRGPGVLRAGQLIAVVVPERRGVPEHADDDGERAASDRQRPARQPPALDQQHLRDEGTVEKAPGQECTATRRLVSCTP